MAACSTAYYRVFERLLPCVCYCMSSPVRAVPVEKLTAVWTLLEAFGNCRTVLNTNATRFTSVFSLDFDQSGQAASGSVQVSAGHRSKVTARQAAGQLCMRS